MSEIVLSGIRATGALHLGNYLGAMRQFVAMQDLPDTTCLYFIADIHTLTDLPDPDELRDDLIGIATGYLAAGLDPERSILYTQSSVPEITELAVLLGNLIPVSELLRLPQYQAKADSGASLGLLFYPVLMAADILGPKATQVPVGEDQLKHLEMAQDIARRFNNRYGDVFPRPEALKEEAIRVPGLDGSGKMSKSAGNTIDLTDHGDDLFQKVRPAKTDPARQLRTDPGNPEVCNIFTLHQFVTPGGEGGGQLGEIVRGCKQANIGCVDCKRVLCTNLDDMLASYRERHEEFADRPHEVREILFEGGKRARVLFRETILEVRDAMGLPNHLLAPEGG